MPAAIDNLRGSIPPLVTPFKNGEVDYDAYARLVAMQIEKGSHGILVNGTTSEPALLTIEERNKLVDVSSFPRHLFGARQVMEHMALAIN